MRSSRAPRRGARVVALLAVAVLLLLPGAAHAQGSPRTDPEAGSPAESVYGIPLEEARRDAAPAALPSSALRTEQGVGSSARVPGIRRESTGGGGEGEPEELDERLRERRRLAARAAARISGDSSGLATTTVLVLVVAIAAVGGIGAGRLVGPRGHP